ncbi:MAG: RNA-binding protein [Chlamydiota bacterium]
MKLFVGNIPFSMTEEELKEIFEKCGSLVSCKLIVDFETGRSRGFGFIEYSSEEDAQKAIAEINDQEFKGKKLVVNQARSKEKKDFQGNRRQRNRF